MLFRDVPLRTRRALSLFKVYGDSALLVLNGTSFNSINALLALNRRYATFYHGMPFFISIHSLHFTKIRAFKGEVQSRITIISKERVKISLQIGAKIMKIG